MLYTPRYLPCARCGGSMDSRVASQHTCAPERLIDFAMFALRDNLAAFPADLATWMGTPRGSFSQYLAARSVRDRT